MDKMIKIIQKINQKMNNLKKKKAKYYKKLFCENDTQFQGIYVTKDKWIKTNIECQIDDSSHWQRRWQNKSIEKFTYTLMNWITINC